jgi:hypothetical protein
MPEDTERNYFLVKIQVPETSGRKKCYGEDKPQKGFLRHAGSFCSTSHCLTDYSFLLKFRLKDLSGKEVIGMQFTSSGIVQGINYCRGSLKAHEIRHMSEHAIMCRETRTAG